MTQSFSYLLLFGPYTLPIGLLTTKLLHPTKLIALVDMIINKFNNITEYFVIVKKKSNPLFCMS